MSYARFGSFAKNSAKKKADEKKGAKKTGNTRKAKANVETPVEEKPTEKFSVYKMVTDRIIKMLEDVINGIAKKLPWQMPWCGGASLAISGATRKPYSFLNQMLLGRPGEWYTFKQIQEKGAKIKKGCKASPVVFFKWIEDKSKDPDPETGKRDMIPLLRYYNVFHVDDIEGIEPRIKEVEPNPDIKPDEKAEAVKDGYVKRSGVKLRICKSNSAYYRPSTDEIVVPEMSQYANIAEYYSTMFHEMTHSTGHESRLKRIASTAFASHEYSKEELVAEMGAASLVNYCGLETESSFKNSVAYIEGWISKLKNDPRMAVSAANQAEKAFKLIVGEEEKENEVHEEAA